MSDTLQMIDTQEIATILDTTRQRHGITSDEKLAHYLGVSDQAIYRWRRGKIDKSARILVALTRQILQSPGS